MILNSTKGFTLIEILFVLSILGILFAIVTPQFNRMKDNQILNSTTDEVLSTINKASSQSLASFDSSAYGVAFASDRITLFKGTVYDVNAVTNEVVYLKSPAIISNISFGGVSSLYFNRLTGVPSANGSFSIELSSGSDAEKVISIDATGRISTN